MELIRKHWTEKDIDELLECLTSLSRGEEKSKWEQNIVNTNLTCLGITAPNISAITKQIAKGNYMEFIELLPWQNYPIVTILGKLICEISDFNTLKNYLDKYSKRVDNWAHCDCLKLKINNANRENFFRLAQEYIKSTHPFQRRIGIIILFSFIDEQYLKKIFHLLDSLHNEEHYYVNMANAWLVCECFIKQRNITLAYLEKHHLNNFTINKAISKCRDSFRVSSEDKELLLKFKK